MKPPPLIDSGIILAATGIHFRYRCFLDTPIGIAILYAIDKSPERVLQEIELEENDHKTVFWQNTGQVLPVWTNEDGSKDVPAVLLNVYAAIIDKSFTLIEVDPVYFDDHRTLFELFKHHYLVAKLST